MKKKWIGFIPGIPAGFLLFPAGSVMVTHSSEKHFRESLHVHPLSIALTTGFESKLRRVNGDLYADFSTDFVFDNGAYRHSMCRQING